MMFAPDAQIDYPTPERDFLSTGPDVISDRPIRSAAAATLAAEIADVIRRDRAGDPRAMDELVRRVTPWLYRIAVNHRLSHHSAQDVVQDTLLALVRCVRTVRDPQAGLAWLSVVARRQAVRIVRGEQRVQLSADLEATAAGDAETVDDPERRALQALSRTVLDRAIAELPDRHARFLRLAFLADERDYATISRVLDMPVGSIGPTRQRALRRMRALLGDWGDDVA
jgi:RNA polymerase sigma factor (sigma-70 family)